MSTKPKYAVVSVCDCKENFEKEVNELIEYGYEPFGTPAVNIFNGDNIIYSQAMIKWTIVE